MIDEKPILESKEESNKENNTKENKSKEMNEIEKMNQINIFESMEVLEPKCPKCEIKLDYGANTTYSDNLGTHICNECGTILR